MVGRTQSVNDFMVSAEIDYHNCYLRQMNWVYRIIQESLSNIIKYSNAIAAKITIIDKPESLFIEITKTTEKALMSL
jgi:signal transduction histidine kinase